MPTLNTSDTLTGGVRVTAEAFYLADESDPDARQFKFGYRITILNEGGAPLTLLSRHWHIIDANGQSEEVDGPGVIGQTPHLAPGEGFKYTSYCPLKTRWGTMEGSYLMEKDDGTQFEAKVGRFYLVMPAPAAKV